MIASGDIGNLLFTITKSLKIPCYQGGNQKDYSTETRAVIHMHKMEKEPKFMKCFADVNVIVPDEGNEARTGTLKQYEQSLMELYYEPMVRVVNDHPLLIEIHSMGIEEDQQLKSHFVNCKLLISVLR